MPDDERDIIQALADHELAIKHLYEAYAQVFPRASEFWLRLADEEQYHAELLFALSPEVGKGKLLFGGNPPKMTAVRTSIEYVKEQISRARQGDLALTTALSIGRSIEGALLEKELFKVSDVHSPPVQSALTHLARETDKHQKALADALMREGHAKEKSGA